MDLEQFSKYTIEGACSLLLAVLAYKLYKLRVATASSCCGEHVKIKTVSRGDSSTDLELPVQQQRPRSTTITSEDDIV